VRELARERERVRVEKEVEKKKGSSWWQSSEYTCILNKEEKRDEASSNESRLDIRDYVHHHRRK
jgi:CRISPR/Cas system-associated endoribonuclease Cas2